MGATKRQSARATENNLPKYRGFEDEIIRAKERPATDPASTVGPVLLAER
jgi:hypothetical protein